MSVNYFVVYIVHMPHNMHLYLGFFCVVCLYYVYISARSGVYYASVTSHNTLETVLKRAYFMTGLTMCSACDVQLINRSETPFSCHA